MDYSAFEKLPHESGFWNKINRLMLTGYLLNNKAFKQFIQDNTFNLTFLEAYKKTGIKINVTITGTVHQKTKLCNLNTTPHVYLWSAALASCSLPFVYTPTELVYKHKEQDSVFEYDQGRSFTDGSIGCDLPMNQLSMLYNISNIIVAQCNPYILPFLSTSHLIKNHKRYWFYKFKDKMFELIGGEIRLRLQQLQDNKLLPKRLKLVVNMCKFLI